MQQNTRIRIIIYGLLALSTLQTYAICKQAQWLQEQRALIRLLWKDRHARSSLHTFTIYKVGGGELATQYR